MRKFIFTLAVCIIATRSHAQSLPDLDGIKLDAKSDFNETAEKAVMQASDYLLTTPLEKGNIDRLKATRYVLRWMSGTPDYQFSIDESAVKLTKKNEDLLGVYMAAMVKNALEHKTDPKDPEKAKLNTIKMVIAYAKVPGNNVKISGDLKKAVEADDKGQLAEYLKE